MKALDSASVVTPSMNYITGDHEKKNGREERNDTIWEKRNREISSDAHLIGGAEWLAIKNEAYINFRRRNKHEIPHRSLIFKYLLEAARNLKIFRCDESLDYVESSEIAVEYLSKAICIEEIERKARIAAALKRLMPQAQVIIRMRYWDDCTAREVAYHLHISVALVYESEYKSRALLRNLLRDYAPAIKCKRVQLIDELNHQEAA